MIYTSEKARNKNSENLLGFNEIQSRLKSNQPKVLVEKEQNEEQPQTIESLLNSHNTNSNFSTRYRLANMLGIKGYTGRDEQNLELMGLINGRASENQNTRLLMSEEDKLKADRDFKKRELDLREREISLKQPTKEEIAQSLLEKFNNE